MINLLLIYRNPTTSQNKVSANVDHYDQNIVLRTRTWVWDREIINHSKARLAIGRIGSTGCNKGRDWEMLCNKPAPIKFDNILKIGKVRNERIDVVDPIICFDAPLKFGYICIFFIVN